MQGSGAELKDCSVCLSNLMAPPRRVQARIAVLPFAHAASATAGKAAMGRGHMPVKLAWGGSRHSRVGSSVGTT
jgi:hypothetical protein